ncbi:hypothetical protein [Aureimonas frigidaquae]|uniref:hypothetical protein n=1 Tax=Aureimonas frigidaquae TaxID=424757 RepID=UPI000781FA6C|nr:hypothetical protein [Aureimonas frigidaquae]
MQNHPMRQAVASVLSQAGADPNHSLAERDVPRLIDAVADSLLPGVQHLANKEPWYASRVTWGAIISGLAPLLGLGAGWLDAELGATALASAGAAIGAGLTLYGRWRAQRPIGR